MKDKTWICPKMLEIGLNIKSSTGSNLLLRMLSDNLIKDVGFKNIKFSGRRHSVHAYSLK